MMIEWVWPFMREPSLVLPSQWVGWLGWGLLLLLWGWGLQRVAPGALQAARQHWYRLLGLAFLAPLMTLLVGLQIGGEALLPLPYLPGESPLPLFLPLAAIPWVAAAGWLGPFWAAWIALESGLFIGIWVTHDLFTPLLISGLGLLYGFAVTQAYRGRFWAWLRLPWVAALVTGVVYAPILVLGAFFAAPGGLATRLDFAFSQSWLTGLVRYGELLLAGGVAAVMAAIPGTGWRRPSVLTPAPWETSLANRLLFVALPLVTLLFLIMTASHWMVAGAAARGMLRERLSGAAQVAAEGLPYFLESGQSLVARLADPALLEQPPETIRERLAQQLRAVPYFHRLMLFDATGHLVAAYPDLDLNASPLSVQETQGLSLAIKGVPIQVYTILPAGEKRSMQVSFMAGVRDVSGVKGVLVGRTDFDTNPFTQPALAALRSIVSEGGDGFILDENGIVLYQANPTAGVLLGEPFGGVIGDGEPRFYEGFSPLGIRQFIYYQPVVGKPWSVILIMPAQRAQDMALQIASPTLILLVLFAGLLVILSRVGSRTLVTSLSLLASQATRIAQGQLDAPVRVDGVDEVGRLGRAFEQMRLSLKARLEELNKLLRVSQAVAANLDIEAAIAPALEVTLGDHVVTTRVVLIPEVKLDFASGQGVALGQGSLAGPFAYLDEVLFEEVRQQNLLAITNVGRARRFQEVIQGRPYPAALVALPLRYENTYYGVFWIGYDQPRAFADEELRFLETLAGNIAMAAANARLYATAEVGRKRLEAVLASVPEPVLVFDNQNTLLLLNPAALQVRGLFGQVTPGSTLEEVITVPALLELLSLPPEARFRSQEITLAEGRVYHASVATVWGEEYPIGKVCVLQDITHYKQLDALKSEFVATVSHDLRSPLTLIRGYVTMLQMIGDLNEQQQSYLQKIVHGLETMTRLVNNLLDLGRIEAGIELRLENLNPAEVVNQVIAQLQPQAAQKGIEIQSEFHLPEGLVLRADPDLLKQALLNLVDNAIKYTRLHGSVWVSATCQNERVIFAIRDNGIGIAPLDLPRLFEKFYRSRRREAHEQRGTGLGLAIVKSIVDRHRGRVWVESQLGKGSVFYIELPLDPENAESMV
ncbi:ATP-binding protein [uncultured Thermanaerothrix sp.]|uniref:ATP-binding protein n=1 Tax=uncultured Thermanaerothrix sp. TaxID=1195149 RepID=UPI00262F6C53|nr:ATP-binding protein [uncultured Thermanaerothrix sp.]